MKTIYEIGKITLRVPQMDVPQMTTLMLSGNIVSAHYSFISNLNPLSAGCHLASPLGCPQKYTTTVALYDHGKLAVLSEHH